MNTITRAQWIGIVTVVLSATAAATAYFTDMFGPNVAKEIAGTASFLNLIVGGISVVINGQNGQVREVANMPGVQSIEVNNRASATLAAVAIDPSQEKVTPASGQKTDVTDIAKGN